MKLNRIFKDFNLVLDDFFRVFNEFEGTRDVAIAKFSGGERRIIEAYLIIKSRSMFSILDEPFSQITPLQIEKIKELILAAKKNKGFLITDHLYQNVIGISNRLYLLKSGVTHQITDIIQLKELAYLP